MYVSVNYSYTEAFITLLFVHPNTRGSSEVTAASGVTPALGMIVSSCSRRCASLSLTPDGLKDTFQHCHSLQGHFPALSLTSRHSEALTATPTQLLDFSKALDYISATRAEIRLLSQID